MVYAFKQGAQIKANPQIAGEMCERLAEEGRLTARDLVEENRPETAPLHSAFEWNDDIAAENWREQQARHIIACLITRDEKKEPVRCFFNIVRSEPTYRHIDSILQSVDDTQRLLQTALSELQAFERKYSKLQELAQVFEAIELAVAQNQ